MTQEAIRTVVKAFAVVSFFVGGIGSILVVPLAITNNAVYVAVSGLYFVAGAVMITGGLCAYAVLIKDGK